jgi:hypothetical protein
MSRFKPSGEFELDSARYDWSVRHYAGASTPYSNLRGVSASIWLREKIAKELIIDFPLKDYFFVKPKSTAEFERRLQRYVGGAIELGWKPATKGKPFRVNAEDIDAVLQR